MIKQKNLYVYKAPLQYVNTLAAMTYYNNNEHKWYQSKQRWVYDCLFFFVALIKCNLFTDFVHNVHNKNSQDTHYSTGDTLYCRWKTYSYAQKIYQKLTQLTKILMSQSLKQTEMITIQ